MDPGLYHHHHLGYIEDLNFWLAEVDAASGPILELGCGTGRIMLPLLEQGTPIYGLDYDMRMLNYLKKQAPEAPVFLADLTRFHLAMQFSQVILPCNTYSTLTAGQRRQALTCIAAHLNPGGIFTASLPNPADLISMGDSPEAGVEDHFLHPESGAPVQVSSSWQTVDNTVTIYWHYDHLQPDGQVKRTTHHTTHQRDPVGLYLEEFAKAGLEVTTMGEYDGSPYHPEADFLILRGRLSG